MIKSLLDVGNILLNAVNNPIGATIIQITLLSSALYGLIALVKSMGIISSIVTQIKMLPALFSAVTGAITGTTSAVTLLGVAANTLFPLIGLITAAITIGTKIYDELTVTLEEQKQIVDDLVASLKDLESERDILEGKGELTEEEQRRLDILNAQITANEKLLKVEAQRQFNKQFGEESRGDYTPSVFSAEFWTTPGNEMGATGAERIKYDIEDYYELKDAIADVDAQILAVEKDSADYTERVNELTEQKKKLEDELYEVSDSLTDWYAELQDLEEEMGDDVSPELESLLNLVEKWVLDFGEAGDVTSNMGAEIAAGFDAASVSLNNFASSAEFMSSSLEKIKEDYQSLIAIQESYNQTGKLTAEQLATLTAMSNQYSGAITVENGKLVINAEALYSAAEQVRQKAIEDAKATAVEQLRQIALNGVNTELENQEDSADTASDNLSTYYEVVTGLINGTYDLATAQAILNNTLSGGTGSSATRIADNILAAQRKVMSNLMDQVALINATDFTGLGVDIRGVSDSTTTAQTAEEQYAETLKTQSDAFKELNEQIEHNIFLKEKNGASTEELIALYKDYQDQLHQQAEWFRSQGEDENSEYIRTLQEQWWGLQDTINDLYDDIEQRQRDAFDKGIEDFEDYIEQRNKLGDWGADNEIAAYQRVLNWMDLQYNQGLVDYEYYWERRAEIAEDRQEAIDDAYEKAEEAWKDLMQQQIDDLEEQQGIYETLFNLVADKAQDEIDALEEQKTAIEDRYQAQIDALQQTNNELDDQIEKEEALDAIARARQSKVMVYKDGRFQYVNDIDKVSEAQANLEKIQRQQILEEELKNLEDLRDQEIASIDKQIEYWEKYKEEWASVVDDYQEQQDKLLVEQELGISLEGENWEKRLGNLQGYVDKYTDIMESLLEAQKKLEQGFQDNLEDILNGALAGLEGVQGGLTDLVQGGGGLGGGGSSGTGITPGSGSLAGSQYNAWAWVPGSGYVPVTVEGGKTQQWGLPEGTIIYGDEDAWIITGGGTQNGEGYTSEYYGKTPDNIWTPNKGSSDASDTRPSAPAWNTGGGGGSSSRPSSGSSSKPSSGGNYTGSSTTGGPSYNIGSQAGKDFINNAKPGSTLTGGDGSSWTKNPDGSTTITQGGNTWVVPKHAMGTINAPGGFSLVGEKGPELRVLNSGDGVLPADVTKNLWGWGTINPGNFFSNIFDKIVNGTNVTISSLTLPGIHDPEGFIEYFNSAMWRRTLQFQSS